VVALEGGILQLLARKWTMMQIRNSQTTILSPRVKVRHQLRLKLNLGTAFLIGLIPTLALILAHYQAVG